MQNLNDAKIAIIGAGGFIGTNICKNLVNKSLSITAFGRSKPFPEVIYNVNWISGDFNTPADLASAVEGCNTVIHLVTASTPASSNADKISDAKSSILSTLHLLEICRNCDVKKIIFISSGGTVYGNRTKLPISEKDETTPITAYGVSKLSIERYLYLYEYLHGIEHVILRVSNPYGPYQLGLKNQGVVAVFLRKMLEGQPIEIWGDGSVCRDYVYIDDVVDAIEAAILYKGEERIFNVGSGIPRSIRDIIHNIEKVCSTNSIIIQKEARKYDVSANYLDISMAKKELGWSPSIKFDEGLRRTENWMRDYIYKI